MIRTNAGRAIVAAPLALILLLVGCGSDDGSTVRDTGPSGSVVNLGTEGSGSASGSGSGSGSGVSE